MEEDTMKTRSSKRSTGKPSKASRVKLAKAVRAARVEPLESRRLLSVGLDYSGGFADTTGLTLNAEAQAVGSQLQLVSNAEGLSGSTFSSTPQEVGRFNAQFTFRFGNVTDLPSIGGGGDGMTFTLQRNSPTAIGGDGGALGYGSGPALGFFGNISGIPSSIAIKFDLIDNNGEGSDSTGLFINGDSPSVPTNPQESTVDLTSSGIDLHSGHSFLVGLSYDGATLQQTITDQSTSAVFAHSYAIDIPSIIGGSSAYAGFTAATGVAIFSPAILSLTYTQPAPTAAPSAPSNLAASPTSDTTARLTWANAADEQSFEVQRSANGTDFTTVATFPAQVWNYTDTGLTAGTSYIYRVRGVNSLGDSDFSNPATVTTLVPDQGFDFAGGFADPTGLTLNGTATTENSVDPLYGLNFGEPNSDSQRLVRASAWSSTVQDITHFRTEFTYQLHGFPFGGIAFVIQHTANSLIGAEDGDQSGYGYQGIDNSIAIVFDNASTGLYQNGVISIGPGSLALGTDSFNRDSFHVVLAYDGSALSEVVTDIDTGQVFSHSYGINITEAIGTDLAYIGFTGAAGVEVGGTYEVWNWTYGGVHAPPPPQAPSALQVTADGPNAATLTWQGNDPSSNGYVIYRAINGDDFGAGTLPPGSSLVASLPPGTTTFTDTGLTPDFHQEYRVYAHNIGGHSAPAEAPISTPVGPPTNLIAIAAGGAVTLNWTPVYQATSYNIYRSTSSGGEGATPYRQGIVGSSFADTDVSSGVEYFYQVTSLNGGNETAPSAEASSVHAGLHASYFSTTTTNFLPFPLPADDQANFSRTDVAGPSTTTVLPNGSQDIFDTGVMGTDPSIAPFVAFPTQFFAVRWEGLFLAPATDTYTFTESAGAAPLRIWVNGEEVATRDRNGLQVFALPIALTGGVSYPIQIEFSGESLDASESRVRLEYQTLANPVFQPVLLSQLSDVVAVPSAPTGFAAIGFGHGNERLTWNEGSKSTAFYTVEESTDGVSFTPVAYIDGASSTSAGVPGLAAGSTYYFRVAAENAWGRAETSSVVATIPVPVSGLTWHYLFDEGQGNIAHDSNTLVPPSDGTFNGLAAISGPTWSGGSGEPVALSFAGGRTGTVQVQDDLGSTLDGTAAMSVWIRTTDQSVSAGAQPYLAPAIAGASSNHFNGTAGHSIAWGLLGDGGQIGLTAGQSTFDGTSQVNEVLSLTSINDGLWHYVVMTRDATTGQASVYVDGVLSGQGQVEAGIEQVSFHALGGLSLSSGVVHALDADLRDLRIYDGTISAAETEVPVEPAGVADELQSVVNSLQGTGSNASANFEASGPDAPSQVSSFLSAIANLQLDPDGTTVNITLDAQGVTVTDSQVSVPPNMVLTINGVTFVGGSPALIVNSGNLVVTNSTFTNSTNAPTILVEAGSLTLRNDIVDESSGYAQAAIEIDGGSVDLGSAADPGGNTFDVNGAGVLLRSGSSGPLIPLDPNAGNTFQIDGHAASADDNLQGLVWTDFNNDGLVDFGEAGIGNISITLSGTDLLGDQTQQTLATDANGIYSFPLLWPGTYSLAEGAVPSAYINGKDAVGTAGGVNSSHSLFSNISIGADQNGLSYNFGQQPAPGSAVARGQAAGIGFWANKNGQALINKFTSIGNWLADTMPNTFGVNATNDLNGLSPAQIAGIFLNDFLLKDKLDAQVMATALNVYATDVSLGGSAAGSYGFAVSVYGLGDSTWNIGSDGAAFNVANNSTLTVMQILQDWDQQNNKTSKTIRQLAIDVFGGINAKGGI
jgi:hypothetical protein